MGKKKRVRRLALAMAQVLPGYMMPTPRFEEADDPFPDHEAAFGGRRADGSLLLTTKGEPYGQAMVRHYLEERGRNRQLYLKLAEQIVDLVDVKMQAARDA